MTGQQPVTELALALRQLRDEAGTPAYHAMVKRAEMAGIRVAASSLCVADKGEKLPSRRVFHAYVLGCRGNPDEWLPRWEAAAAVVQAPARQTTRRRQMTPADTAGRGEPPDPAGALTADDLLKHLRALHQWAGQPSLRAMAAVAVDNGLSLPRSTSQNILHPVHPGALPRRRQLKAFLTVCALPEAHHDRWLALRDDIERRRHYARTTAGTDPPARRPAPDPRTRRAPAPPPPAPDEPPAPAAPNEPAAPDEPARADASTAPDTPAPHAPPRHPDPARGRRRASRVVAIAALALGTLLAALLDADAPIRRPTTDGRGGRLAPLSLQYPRNPPEARTRLLVLVDRASTTSDPPATGHYTHVHIQTWSVETTPVGRRRASVRATDEHLWWAPGVGARYVTTVCRFPLTGTAPPPGAASPIRVEDIPPGGFGVVVDEPATSAMLLAGQLSAHEPFINGPQAAIRAVADLNRYHFLSAAQRAAALRVLADTDGIRDRGDVTDRAGRAGIAVSVDSDGGATRDIAVFDPADGSLISYERVVLVAPPRSAVRAPTVVSYVLYLDRDRADEAG